MMKKKLTDEQVREIYRSAGTNKAIAERYDVSEDHVRVIRKGMMHRDVLFPVDEPEYKKQFGKPKITDETARQILHEPGSIRQVAEKYDVSAACVQRIKARKSWKHIS